MEVQGRIWGILDQKVAKIAEFWSFLVKITLFHKNRSFSVLGPKITLWREDGPNPIKTNGILGLFGVIFAKRVGFPEFGEI